MMDNQNTELIDPDPFVAAGLALNAIGVIFTAVHAFRTMRPEPAPVMKPDHRPLQLNSLAHLESHVENLGAAIDKLTRVVERNASNSDAEFYDAPIRIGAIHLMLPPNSLDQFATHYADAGLQISGIFRWLVNIQQNNPDLAYRLGERLNEPLSGVAERMNEALGQGSSIRTALTELRSTLQALAGAIEAEIGRPGN
ncbi:hypothetical protein [Brevundimonas naejangsanensis]|uniref:hypothetical protein n=1 Tax=Brevundimonas naejangsanensis TaxID=588932 RepID=UPI0039F6CEAC